DDIVLYEAAPPDEAEPFPSKVLFTAGFDTGRQGKEWPGEFEIVPHEKPLTWKAARSIDGGRIRISLRGARPLPGGPLRLRFRARVAETDRFEVSVGAGPWTSVEARPGGWTDHRLALDGTSTEAAEIRFRVAGKGVLWVDDL